MKVVIALAFIAIAAALVSAGVWLIRDGRDGRPKTKKMANALALRIGLSVLLFLFILLSYKLGWIQPTGIRY